MDAPDLKNKLAVSFDSFELRMLELRDVNAIKRMEPGDLSHSQGEWLFPSGREEEFIGNWLQQQQEGKGLWAGIFKGDQAVGLLTLRYDPEPEKKAALSYAMDFSYRGQGVMTKACQRLIYFGFTRLGLGTIEITADVANKPSWAIAERLGFKKETVVPGGYQSAEGKRDVVRYILRRADAY